MVRTLQDMGFVPKEFLTKSKMAEACERFNYQTEDDLFASVGYGEVSPTTLANRLTEEERRETNREAKAASPRDDQSTGEKRTRKMKVRHEGGIVIEGSITC